MEILLHSGCEQRCSGRSDCRYGNGIGTGAALGVRVGAVMKGRADHIVRYVFLD